MTVQELAERDYKKAKINYLRAKEKQNIPPEELEHHRELMLLRKEILWCITAKLEVSS